MKTKVMVICALLILVSGVSQAAQKHPAKISVTRIESVPQVMNGADVAAPVNNVCSVGNLNSNWAISGWLWGDEVYSTFADPSICGCPGTVAALTVNFVVNVTAGIESCDPPVMSVDIRSVEWDGGCAKPGDEIFCQSGAFTIGYPGPGTYLVSLPLPPCAPLPPGPFFVSMEYIGPVCGSVQVVTDDSPEACNSYNDWGEGWVDLVADYGFPGKLTLFADVECASLAATVDIDPNTLNLKSKGKYVTCYIELDGADPAEIDVSTILLNGMIPVAGAPIDPQLGDYDMDGVPDLMVKFSRSALIASLAPESALRLDERGMDAALEHGDMHDMIVTGELLDGTPFEGTDSIRIINPGGGNEDADTGGQAEFEVYTTPASGAARISFSLDAAGNVNLRVLDAAGRLVRTLESGYRDAGTHYVTWDRKTDDGGRAGSGVYFIKLERQGGVEMQKLLVVE